MCVTLYPMAMSVTVSLMVFLSQDHFSFAFVCLHVHSLTYTHTHTHTQTRLMPNMPACDIHSELRKGQWLLSVWLCYNLRKAFVL